MLEKTQHLIKKISKSLNIDATTLQQILTPEAVHDFEITISETKKYQAYRVQHNSKYGPYKGGIRFHPQVSLGEVKALSILMSLKTAAVGLPLGGGKGGIAVDPRSLTRQELEQISRAFVRQLEKHIGPDKDIPAPDVNTNAEIMDWMVDEYEQLTGDKSRASFTGKSISKGGSLGREAATGRGGVIALAELLKSEGKVDRPITFAIQGFGNVGSFFAEAAQYQSNWQLVAVSDSQSGIYDKNGLDIAALVDFKKQKQHFEYYADKTVARIENEELLNLEVDVLVLAAMEGAINNKNEGSVRAKYIIEMANGPVDELALHALTERGIVVMPDIIANAGGVIVSYLEWLQNKNGEAWTEEKVNSTLKDYMEQATQKLFKEAKINSISLTEAAYTIALARLAK